MFHASMTASLAPASLRGAASQTRQEQTIARILGTTSYDSIDWRSLLTKGVLVDLDIGRSRFLVRLDGEDLLITVEGEQARTALSKKLILGEKRLLPQRYLSALAQSESAARTALRYHSFPTPLGAFVPVSAYRSWTRASKEVQQHYCGLRDEIVGHYPSLIREVLGEYEGLARHTYERLQTTHPHATRLSEAQFVTQYCNGIRAQIKTREEIEASFAFQIKRLWPPAQVEALAAQPATHPAVGEPLLQEEYALLSSDLQEQAHSQMQTTLSAMLFTFVAQIRHLIYISTTDVLTTLHKRSGESLSPRSIAQLRRLIARVRLLLFYQDREIEQMMAHIGRIVRLSSAERSRQVQQIEHVLRAIATLTRATLLDLDAEPRSARACYVPDTPTASQVREARLVLEGTVVSEANRSHEPLPLLPRPQAPELPVPSLEGTVKGQWHRALLPFGEPS